MKKVFMYTQSTCPWCKKTKRFFAERGIPFEFIDYDLEPPAEQEKIEIIMEQQGGVTFPWVLIGDTVVVGWNPDAYARLLGLDTDRRI